MVIIMVDTIGRYMECDHQHYLQRLRGLRPIDDAFIRALFRKKIPLVPLVLRIITVKDNAGKLIHKLTVPQKTVCTIH